MPPVRRTPVSLSGAAYDGTTAVGCKWLADGRLCFCCSNESRCVVNHKYLSEWLDYHYWAQDRVFAAVEPLSSEQFTRGLGNSFPSVRDTLVHIHFAECLWYARWQREPLPMPSVETFPDLESVRQASKEHEFKMRALLERLGQDGINESMDYTSRLDGKDHRSPFWHMFQHVINHGTYHRGQVTMMLRQLGAKPIGTDLILFYWDLER
jgi:uncharacterized damage-inducible protein DinB